MLKKAIVSMLIVLLAFLCLTTGIFIGRRTLGKRATITYELDPVPTQPISPTALNINTATVEELMTLPGIGEALATRIVEYRYHNGLFNTIEELIFVDGIGVATIERLRTEITVGG